MSAPDHIDAITLSRDRLTVLAHKWRELGATDLTRAAAARDLINAALSRSVINVPDGLRVLVNHVDDDGQGGWLGLTLTTTAPYGLQVSDGGLRQLPAALRRSPRELIAWAAANLNDALSRCDPRGPSTREALIRALSGVRGGDPAAVHELCARYAIGDEDLEARP